MTTGLEPFVPIAVALLGRVGSQLVDAAVQRRQEGVYDLSGGAPVTCRASIVLWADSKVRPDPYCVLVGLQPTAGRRIQAWAGSPDTLRIVVPRSPYDIVALYFARPTAPGRPPLPIAVAKMHAALVTSRQKLYLPGFTDPYFVRRVRHDLALARQHAAVPGPGTQAPPARALPPARTQGSARPEGLLVAERVRVQPRTPRPVPPPVEPVESASADGICKARTVRGARCRNAADQAGRALCGVHWDRVLSGETVVWHHTGDRIRAVPLGR